ncbi:MAG TPA: peptide chain release factor N(5)-glutamine methyltransferase [Gemmatimonadales bacterium]|nr:peptide chain release factor N(5)-glutamine methyltransferase [Gemmatimonadales bacterium]
MPEVETVAGLLQRAAERLQQAAVPDPRREARRIWQDLTEGRAFPLVDRDATVSLADTESMERAVERRAAGEPLAHVTGLVGFRRLTLKCDRRALIPRPETEGLVELVLSRQPSGVVVDVGTGSGCIALALAGEGRYRHVVGIDQSADALALARENATLTGHRITLVRGDLLTALPPGSADIIVSNPPYLTEAEYASLDGSVRDWEPAPALASGTDGLSATRRLVEMALTVVRPGGWLALEVDATRAGDTAALATAAGWTESAVYMDLFGRARFVVARRNEAA